MKENLNLTEAACCISRKKVKNSRTQEKNNKEKGLKIKCQKLRRGNFPGRVGGKCVSHN